MVKQTEAAQIGERDELLTQMATAGGGGNLTAAQVTTDLAEVRAERDAHLPPAAAH